MSHLWLLIGGLCTTGSFGIGTFLTNDFRSLSSGGKEKSKALNMVIKLADVDGKPCIKISDEITKVGVFFANTDEPGLSHSRYLSRTRAIKRQYAKSKKYMGYRSSFLRHPQHAIDIIVSFPSRCALEYVERLQSSLSVSLLNCFICGIKSEAFDSSLSQSARLASVASY